MQSDEELARQLAGVGGRNSYPNETGANFNPLASTSNTMNTATTSHLRASRVVLPDDFLRVRHCTP
jgi:hypothetical protein